MGYLNPLLKLPAAQRLAALPASPEKALLVELLLELRADADRLAELSWRKRKGPMAAYWRAASTYALHTARAIGRGGPVEAPIAYCKARMADLTTAQRVDFFDSLKAAFCDSCGSEDGRRCCCMRDD